MKLDNSKQESSDLKVFGVGPKDTQIKSEFNSLIYWLIYSISPVFKVAKVTPVLKKGNAQIVFNYRPISVLRTFSKILEKLIYKRILSFFNQNKALTKLQFGFRPSLSTQLACFYLSSKLCDFFNNHDIVLAIFLD